MKADISDIIKSLISADSDISSITNGRNYCLVIPEGTAVPYLFYKCELTGVEYAKDKSVEVDTHKITVSCVADDYATASEFAGAVRGCLEMADSSTADYKIDSIELESVNPGYVEDWARYAIEVTFLAYGQPIV